MKLRAYNFTMWLVVAALVAPAWAQDEPGPDDYVTNIYDLRDLRAVLPPLPPGSPDDVSPSGALLESLVSGLESDLPRQQLSEDVYAVSGLRRDQAKLLKLLSDVRQLYSGRYELRLAGYALSLADPAPGLGDAPPSDMPAWRQTLVVPRRTLTAVGPTRSQTYFVNLNPIVAQSAVAYAGVTQTIESGVRLNVIVGAGNETEESTSLLVTGDVTHDVPVTVFEAEGCETAPAFRLRTARVYSSHVRSDLSITYGKPVVIAVAPLENEEQVMVIVAMIRRLAD